MKKFVDFMEATEPSSGLKGEALVKKAIDNVVSRTGTKKSPSVKSVINEIVDMTKEKDIEYLAESDVWSRLGEPIGNEFSIEELEEIVEYMI